MRPNLAGVSRVMGRIEEIERIIRPDREEEAKSKPKSRFVDVLEKVEKEDSGQKAELRGRKDRAPTVPGIVPTETKGAKESSGHWQDQIAPLAAKYGVDESLVRAVIRMESGGQTAAVSPKGAMGIMQLMPGTARMLGVEDPFDPAQNLEGGIKYLSQLSDKYQGDMTKTLAAYNAGPGRVDAYGGIPPFAETQNYVKNVLAMYRRNSGSDD